MTVPKVAVVMLTLLLLPAAAGAQLGTGTITGVVRDSSGAVLPGATVEAASPALIEKVRVVTTDSQGVYRIVDLRPGVYAVTFTLGGFTTLRREGIELTTGFTATVNAELGVGAVEETVTVSGAAPVVDTQSSRQQEVFTRETLDAVPIAGRTGSYVALLPAATTDGAVRDVGGTTGELQGARFTMHGQRGADQGVMQDGMSITVFTNTANFSFNPHAQQEVVLETSGASAETTGGGVWINIVPKDGGNVFSGSFNANFGHPDLQSSNLNDALRARGLRETPSLRKIYDVGGGFGGPIRRDRLWFYNAHRRWLASKFFPGNFFGKQTPGTLTWEPDLTRPAFSEDQYQDHSLRFTWAATPKDTVTLSGASQPSNCNCPVEAPGAIRQGTMAADSGADHWYKPNYYGILNWKRPATSRLLFEGGGAVSKVGHNSYRPQGMPVGQISVLELSINRLYGGRGASFGNTGCNGSYSTNCNSTLYRQQFTVSYITGSHTFKTGVALGQRRLRHKSHTNVEQIGGARTYTVRNGVPQSVTIFATPFGAWSQNNVFGAYAQEQWTIEKLTLNLGVRYDNSVGSAPEEHFSAGYFVSERTLPAVEDSPNWKNVSPRLGAAYDLFGNGRTAIKASLGRYPSGTANYSFALNLPIDNLALSATRTWNDANRNFTPDCVLGPSVPGANGECGALSDLNFGRQRPGTRWDDDVLEGFHVQPYNWQTSVVMQHELRQAIGLTIGYFRTWHGNFRATDNLALTPANFDPFCITAPVDSRLPGGGGNQLCGLYDIRPDRFGQVDNLITQMSHYGKQTDVYNGADVTLNARFGQGGVLQGGFSVGRSVLDNCVVIDSPQAARPDFCKTTPPWSAGTNLKFLVVYPLPWGIRTSAIYQNLPGFPITASLVVPNAQVVRSLGRNLGACRGAAVCNANVTVDLIPPGALYEERSHQLDLRFAKIFRIGNYRMEGNFDLYNVTNSNSVLTQVTRYGPQWRNATTILDGRLVKFGVQLDF